MECLKDIDAWNENATREMQSSVVTDEQKELLSKRIVDLSTEEDYNFIMCTDTFQTPPPPPPSASDASSEENATNVEFHFTEANQYNHYSLLHVAVDYQSTDIVECLLQRKTLVSFKCHCLHTI